MSNCTPLPYSSQDDCSRDHGLLSLLVILAVATNFIYLCVIRRLSKNKVMQQHNIALIGRMALIVPAYSFLMPWAFSTPQSYTLLEAALILVDGYCLYSFFKLFILNATSRDEIIDKFMNSSSFLIFECCIVRLQKDNPNKFLDGIWLAFFQVFMIRPLFALAAALFTEDLTKDSKSAAAGFITFTVLQIVSLAISFYATVRLYLSAHSIVKDFLMERKAFFLWFVVVLVLVETQLLASGKLSPDQTHVETMELRRILALTIGIEMFVLSLFMPCIFPAVNTPLSEDLLSSMLFTSTANAGTGAAPNESSATGSTTAVPVEDEVSRSLLCGNWFVTVVCFWKYTFRGILNADPDEKLRRLAACEIDRVERGVPEKEKDKSSQVIIQVYGQPIPVRESSQVQPQNENEKIAALEKQAVENAKKIEELTRMVSPKSRTAGTLSDTNLQFENSPTRDPNYEKIAALERLAADNTKKIEELSKLPSSVNSAHNVNNANTSSAFGVAPDDDESIFVDARSESFN